MNTKQITKKNARIEIYEIYKKYVAKLLEIQMRPVDLCKYLSKKPNIKLTKEEKELYTWK